MIRGFWVIDQGGICRFYESFGEDVKHDPNMLSSFMSAIFTFSKEIGQKSLELSETEEFRFVYTMRPPLLFVLAGDKQELPETLKSCLEQIIGDFFSYYEETVWLAFLKSRMGDDTAFMDYVDRLMTLLRSPEPKLENHRERRESLAVAFSKFIKSAKKEII
ncbi:MAG: hypothetical protein ACE5I5_02655 [Candidatus Heimdallarchaeota archaeon]